MKFSINEKVGKYFFLCALALVVLVSEYSGSVAITGTVTAPSMLFLLILSGFFISFRLQLMAALVIWAYATFRLPMFLAPMSEFVLVLRSCIWFLLMVGLTSMIQYLNKQWKLKYVTSEARSRALIDFAHDSFISMDSAGKITDWNHSAEKMFGWSAAEAIHRNLAETIVPERFRESHNRGLNRYLKSGTGAMLNRTVEISAIHRKGHEFPVGLTIYPIKSGDQVQFGSFLQDISLKKQHEQIRELQLSMAEMLAKAKSLVSVSKPLLHLLSEGLGLGRIELWIKDSKSFTMHKRAEFSVKNETSLLGTDPDMQLESIIEKLKSIFTRNLDQIDAFFEFENVEAESLALGIEDQKNILILKIAYDGEIRGLFVLFDFKNARDAVLESFFHSLTSSLGAFVQKKLAQEEIANANRELEEKIKLRTEDLAMALEQAESANKLKDEFLATISHELRTPMGVILGYTQLLLEEDLPEEIASPLKIVARNANSQNQINSDLLDVSRIITGKMSLDLAVVDLNAAIKQALESVQLLATAKEIEISLDLLKSGALIRGDEGRLQQVLWNVLTNALKFSERRSKVIVSLKQLDSFYEIAIIDFGKGIEPTFIAHVFDRFRQEDSSSIRKFGGLGLGLAIVRHITEAHGGSVSVQSEGAGKGANFKVVLPMLAVHGEAKVVENFDGPGPSSLKDLKILVVEDDVDTRFLLESILAKAGCKVESAASAELGLEKFKTFLPDILLSDISMPGRDGKKLIQDIRALSEKAGGLVPAIALSARGLKEEISESLAAGFTSYLIKPTKQEHLLAEVRKVLSIN